MILLVVLGLFLREKSAEEAFKAIEETVARAKTVGVEFEVSMKSGNDTFDSSGTLLFKEGNRAHLGVTTVAPGGFVIKQILASDGTKVRFSAPTELQAFSLKEKEAPAILLPSLHAGLLDLRKVVKLRSVTYGKGDENVG